MKYVLNLLLLFASCGILAQSSFFNHMQDAARYDPFDILIKSDGNILFCTAAKQSENGIKTNYIYELDQWGQMLNSWTLHNDTIYWIENRRMIEDEGKIFVFGRGFETGPNWNKAFITMYVFDLNLNLLEEYELNLPGYAYEAIWPSKVKLID